MRNLQPPWPISQTLTWKNAIQDLYDTILFFKMEKFYFSMVEIPFPKKNPNISFPKTQSVNIFCFIKLMFTSVQSSVI